MTPSLDAIRRRISVRTYDGSPLDAESAEALRGAFVEVVPGPFGGRARFLLTVGGEGLFGGDRIGTYGQIRGAPAFIVGAIARGPHAMEDFGYALEGVLLRATELGLGSCWLGGVFGRGRAARFLQLGPGELIPACSPVGRPAPGVGIQDRLIRMSAGSHNRKAAREISFELQADGSWAPGLTDTAIGEIVEAVRVGPSASNKQPWRLLYDPRAGRLHLFLEEDRFYNSMLGEIKLQNLDMGIAMRHIEAACRSLGMSGFWKEPEGAVGRTGRRRSIATWVFG